MGSDLLIGIVSLFGLIAITAFFVFSEYSLAVSRRTRISELAERGNSAAKVVLRVMADPDRFFAATQVGITFTSLAIGVVSEPAFSGIFSRLIGDAAAGLPGLSSLSVILGTLFGLLIASYFQIVLAELVPRSITIRHAERVALIVVPTMNTIAGAFRPFVWLLKNSSRFVLRLLGFGPNADGDRVHSLEELRMLVDESERGGVIESEQGDMLDAVFTFGDTTVREVMVPRTEMTCVDIEASLHDVAHVFSTHAYSRVPVFETDIDHIAGILHIKDLMRALLSPTRTPSIRQLMREPFFVPDTQRADELLGQLRARREYLAVVLDEYGGTAGLVTLNDLVERIIGEVQDAASPGLPGIQHTPNGSAIINGLTSIGDVNDAFNLQLVDENYDTIGGYIMGRLGRIPKAGDEVMLADQQLVLRVEEMDKLRVAKVALRRVPAE